MTSNSYMQRLSGRHAKREAGLTLLELMVALALGGFLVLGVVNVFLTTKESSTVEASLARVQESGRFALDILSDDIRRAHYTGCNSVNSTIVPLVKDFRYFGLRGYEKASGTWSPTLDANDPVLEDATTLAVARDGSDMLHLHTAELIGENLLTADVLPTDLTISLEDNPLCSIEDDDWLVLSNCLTSHLMEAGVSPSCSYSAGTKVATTLTLDPAKNDTDIAPGYIYTAKTELMKFESVVWFVADTGRDRSGMDVYALYRFSSNDTDPVEMIEGVEFMELQYGQRGGFGTNPTTRFVDGSDTDLNKLNDEKWHEVVSVRVALLVQNYDEVRDEDDARSYVLLDPNTPIAPADHGGGRALRQVFKVTTALRNTDFDT